MLLRHGNVIAEGWWSPYAPDRPHMLFSLSKTFTSTAVGLAIHEGCFSIDDPVLSFFPDDTPANVSEHLAAMRVRDLLTMSSGHSADTWQTLEARADGNWTRAFLESPLEHAPGTHFVYNTGATYMLSAIVQKTTGMKLVDFLQPRLFAPLGIENARWDESPQGINLGGIGLWLKTEDIARFGQLYLQKGMWQGTQIVPEAWIAEATAVQIANGDMAESDWTQGYGYQIWQCRHGAYRADGVFGQYCIVMPEQDAVLAITGGMDVFDMQEPLDMIWEMLLPAMGDVPLPEDAAAASMLADKFAKLALPRAGMESISPDTARLSGRVYAVDANELGIETIALTFTDDGCTINVRTATGDETIPCGYGRWLEGETSLFNDPWLSGLTPVASSAGWSSDGALVVTIRLIETPFYQRMRFELADDEMLIETGVNVALGEKEEFLLTARQV